ncbi:uncharacterized protein RHIMIDRAFT_246140 [Rhizopus microsporus ATCC 52813]|uniref:OTU domain-containing protein n=1 Tax=Rhizopus microsporus ATCC 52813 TaxID=1340429 RepID=A0A2G4SL94_RHIZD|nr:uncharacterized protein RHIMIDRAFT_246140 [Rhizopus microsporus ATCC 52813]PHZ09548.1 hypothetical protein RHIMIDRAFT_246140 [Rhizopus microsporus ATCC 52813]
MKTDGPAVDFHDIPNRWLLDYDKACGYEVDQMKTEGSEEAVQRKKISFNEKLREKLSLLQNDQQREDLLDDLTRSLEKYKAARIDDIDYVAAAIVKGRTKSTTGKRLLSSFEIAEKEAKKSETALSRTGSKQHISQHGTIDYVWPFKRDLEDRIVNNEKKKKKYDDENSFEFFVHPEIPRECIPETVDVGADGFCGFRSLATNIKGNQDILGC